MPCQLHPSAIFNTGNLHSAMAQEWCVAYGVLSHEEAHELWQQILARKAGARRSIKSPVKPASSAKRQKASRGRILDDDDDADTGFDDSAVYETQGATGF